MHSLDHGPSDVAAMVKYAVDQRQSLVRAAARIVGCRVLAEDVVQDAVLKICEAGIGCAVADKAGYVFRMVRNMAVDSLRRRSREPLCPGDDAYAGYACPRSCAASEAVEYAQALRLVGQALDELPDRTRDTFIRHRLDGVPQKTIAGTLGVSPTLVNFMVRDAHAHCLAKLVQSEQ